MESEQRSGFNQLVEFVVNPAQHTQLLAALIDKIERHTCTYPGFVSASVQVSDDGSRVLEQIVWQSQQASEAALLNAQSGPGSFTALLIRHGVSAASFRAFQVARTLNRRL